MILTWRQVKGESLHLAKSFLELAHRSIKNLLTLVNHKNPITELLNITQVMSGQENGCFFLLIDLGNSPDECYPRPKRPNQWSAHLKRAPWECEARKLQYPPASVDPVKESEQDP